MNIAKVRSAYIVRLTDRRGRYTTYRYKTLEESRARVQLMRSSANIIAGSVWHRGARLSYDNWDDGEEY